MVITVAMECEPNLQFMPKGMYPMEMSTAVPVSKLMCNMLQTFDNPHTFALIHDTLYLNVTFVDRGNLGAPCYVNKK